MLSIWACKCRAENRLLDAFADAQMPLNLLSSVPVLTVRPVGCICPIMSIQFMLSIQPVLPSAPFAPSYPFKAVFAAIAASSAAFPFFPVFHGSFIKFPLIFSSVAPGFQ